MQELLGLTGTATLKVTDSDTAIAVNSGDVPVLATPRLIALLEEATFKLLEGRLDPGMTSVGSRVEIEHVAPTPVGDTVISHGEVERVEGRKITMRVSAQDSRGTVATGKIVRALVNRSSFLAKLA